MHYPDQSSIVELLASLSERIVMGASLEEALEFIYNTFRIVLPYDRIGFAEVNMDKQSVHTRWHKSRRPTVLGAKYSAPLAGSSLGLVLEHRQPRILNDLVAYLQRHPTSRSTALITQEGMKASMTCPLFVRGQPFGFLFFTSATVGAYHEAHVTILKAVSNQLALLLMASHAEPHVVHHVAEVPGALPSAAHASSTILPSELQPGMTVSAPVVLINGRVLVSSGVMLTERIIARIAALHGEGFVRDNVVQVRSA